MANLFSPIKGGLGPLQQCIISLARKQGGTVLARDVLIDYYGFRPLRNPAEARQGALVFDKAAIRHARYNSASVAACKAFNRLVDRGLADRIMSGIRIKRC